MSENDANGAPGSHLSVASIHANMVGGDVDNFPAGWRARDDPRAGLDRPSTDPHTSEISLLQSVGLRIHLL